jgi:ElaB/YqjD/DUF883 family membrane-anchored ribosome-binding protein
MSAIDRLRSWLKRESADAKESWGDLRNRADAELSRKEAQLQETPEQRLERLQHDVRQNDEDFDELRRRIAGTGPPAAGEDPAQRRPDRSS